MSLAMVHPVLGPGVLVFLGDVVVSAMTRCWRSRDNGVVDDVHHQQCFAVF